MHDLESRPLALKRLCSLPLGAAAALTIAARASAATGPLVPVRVGSVANDEATPILYAQTSGLFRDAGLDVELQVISNGTAVAAAVAGGAIDLGRGSLFSIITAHARNVPLTMIAGSAVTWPTTQNAGLVVLADSALHSGADFNGKIVSAAALNDIMVVGVRAWVDKTGGRSETMQFVELTGSEAGAALDSRRIDGAGVVNPWLAQLAASSKYRVVCDPGAAIAPLILSSAWFGNTDYVTKNRSTVRSFATALAKSSAYCLDHPQQTAPLIAKLSGVDVATIQHMTRAHYSVALDPRQIQPLIDAAAKYKIIPSAFDARDMITGAAAS